MRSAGRFGASLLVFVLPGCITEDSAGLPPPPPPLSCQTNNTAQVSFENRSNTNSTYDVIWDGANIFVVAPANTSPPITAAAGVQHILRFQFTNTQNLACNEGTPTLAQCSNRVFSCTG